MRLNYFRVAIIITYCMLYSATSFANRRHFAYLYESAVLPKGAHELEIWNTVRLQRKQFYRRIDTRTEFEFGLGGNFQTSLYLNMSNISQLTTGVLNTEQSFGISNEWKFKLLDATTDAIGIALYAEGSIKTLESEIEGKVILDKKVDNFLFAFNAVAERSNVSAVSMGDIVTQNESIVEFDAGTAYFFTPNFTFGIEARYHTQNPPVIEGGGSYSALFIGPTLAYAGPNWWSAFSIASQIWPLIL